VTDKLDRPPVDPMSDVAWARVERGLWSRIDSATSQTVVPKRSRLWLAVPLGALAAAAIVVVVITRGSATPPAPVASAEEPTRVVAGDAPSSMSFGDVHVELDAHTAMVMQPDSALVETGAAWFSVAPRGDRAPFVVLAGDTRVRVIGTRFRVARSGEHSEVTVDHGIVEVTFHGNVARVAAHQAWSSDQPTRVASTVAEAETESESESEIEMPASAVKHAKPHHAASAATTDNDAARYQQLARLEASQPDVAMKGYLELSQGSGRWAAVALYAAARLAADRNDGRAQLLLEIYLRRFPAGANVADAERLLSRLKGESR